MSDFLPDVPLPYAMQSNAYNTAYTQGYFVLGTQIMCMVSLGFIPQLLGSLDALSRELRLCKKGRHAESILQIQSNPFLSLSQNYTKFKKLKAHIFFPKK